MGQVNQRRHSRNKAANLTANFVCVDDDNKIINKGIGVTLNISESGMLLLTEDPVEKNLTLLISLNIENDIADISAKVTRCIPNGRGKYEVGILFLDINFLYGA